MSSTSVDRRGPREVPPGIARAAAVAACVATLGLGPLGCRARTASKDQPAPTVPLSRRTEKKAPRIPQEVGWVTIGLDDPPASSLMDVKPENLPAYIRSLYRIRPDRRFLYAAAELDRLSSRAPRQGRVSVRFEESRWRISLNGSRIGDLPHLPGFSDAKSFLVSRVPTRKVSQAPSGADPLEGSDRDALENGEPKDLLRALARLNAAWVASPGDPAVAESGLRGLLWLALQTFDELERSDPILGKAMALLAISEANRPGQVAREECLLACLLGYEDDAKLLAKRLPEGDPVRLFADWDFAGLAVLAGQPHPEPRTEYLYLLRLAQSGRKQENWIATFRAASWSKRVNVASLRLRLAPRSGMETESGKLMQSGILADLNVGPGKGEETSPEGQSAALEQAVNKEASRLGGPILDGSVVKAFYLGNFYSSLYAEARYFFDLYGSTDEAERFGNAIADPPAGTGAELKAWILHRVHLRTSAKGLKAVAADLSRLTHIGVAPLSRIVYSVALFQSAESRLTRRAALPGFFDLLDLRPSNLQAAAAAARDVLHDPAIIEECLRAASMRAPHELAEEFPVALGFLGDRAGLHELAGNKRWPPAIRSLAVQELAKREKIESKVLVDQFRELIREDPADGEAIREAVALLEKRNEVDSALHLIDAWLNSHARHDLDWAGIVSSKSRLLRGKGRFQEAWKIAEVSAGTGKQDCLMEASLALIDLGRVDEALEVARGSLERYEDGSSAAMVARILWMKGRDDEASQALTSSARQFTLGDWSTHIPAAFLQAFKKADETRAEAAFLKLAVPSVPILNLIWFVEYLTEKDSPELALKLGERLHGRGPTGWATTATYHARVKARGPAAAGEWLRANATPAELDVLAKQALADHNWNLIWDLPEHPDPTKNEILNLIRAASLFQQPGEAEERRSALPRFFESRPRSNFVVYGLFLLGRVDRATVFATVRNLTDVCSIGWLLGLTSAHETRNVEANAWLQISMEAGADVPPRDWAARILARWGSESATLTELARKKIY